MYIYVYMYVYMYIWMSGLILEKVIIEKYSGLRHFVEKRCCFSS